MLFRISLYQCCHITVFLCCSQTSTTCRVPAKKRWWMTPQRLSCEIPLMAQILSSGFTLAAFSRCSQVSIPWQIQSLSLPGTNPMHPELQVFFPRADWPSHSRAPDSLPPAVTSSEGTFCSSLTTRKISYLDSVSTSTLENSSVAKALAEGWKQTIFFADCFLTAQKRAKLDLVYCQIHQIR